MVAWFCFWFPMGVVINSIYHYLEYQFRNVINPPDVPWSHVSVISHNNNLTSSNDTANTTAEPRSKRCLLSEVSLVKLALGGIIATLLISYYAVLESTCANTDPNEGAGELVITAGGSAKGTEAGTRFPAPLFINAGAKLSANGTVEAELMWHEDLCDGVLDCSTCPPLLDARFTISALRGKVLLHNPGVQKGGLFFMCGYNRIARTLGGTELVGLADASAIPGPFYSPGWFQKEYRIGEFRDAIPHDGDVGIPFPHFHVTQNAFAQFLLNSGINEGATIRAVLKPTLHNPWRSTLCGHWKQLATLIMVGHAGVVEQAISNWIGHVRTSGLRMDLAQLALATEILAHTLLALLHHDPFFSFHWAVLPVGSYSAFITGSIVLTCSSTLLLAAFWYVVSFQ